MKFNATDKWERTSVVAERLGKSSVSLRRLIENGWVTEGTHYMRGPAINSPITWNIIALQKKLLSLKPLSKVDPLPINDLKKEPNS